MKDLGVATSVGELLEIAKAEEQALGEVLWYRGHSNAAWALIPSVHRRNPMMENEFTQRFRFRAPSISRNCPAHENTAAWLPLMQHYGLPTRLLDWSEALLVSAFFAVDPVGEEDRSIWFLAPSRLNKPVIGSSIPFLQDPRVAPLVDAAFGRSSEIKLPDYLAVSAPRTDQRMAMQLGNYTIHNKREALEESPGSNHFLGRAVIPNDACATIRFELWLAGIRASNLFPDLGSLAHEIAALDFLEDEKDGVG